MATSVKHPIYVKWMCLISKVSNTVYQKQSYPPCTKWKVVKKVQHLTAILLWILGRLHDVWIQFCHCEMEVASLVRYGLWPATVKHPQTAISMTLLDLVCRLQLECGPSLKAVCAAIQCSSDASKVCLLVASVNLNPFSQSPSYASLQFEKHLFIIDLLWL